MPFLERNILIAKNCSYRRSGGALIGGLQLLIGILFLGEKELIKVLKSYSSSNFEMKLYLQSKHVFVIYRLNEIFLDIYV